MPKDRFVFYLCAAPAALAAYGLLRRRRWAPIAAFGVVVAAFFFFRAPREQGFTHAVFKMHEVLRALGEGEFPYLSRSILSGAGLPVFLPYSPLALTAPVLLAQLGLGVMTSLKIAFCLLFGVAACGMYRLLRRHAEEDAAAAGALAYVSSTYFLAELFNRFGFTEFHGFALLPWLALFLERWLEGRNRRDGALLVMGGAALFVVHPQSFMNAAPFLLIASAPALARRRDGRALWEAAAAAAAFACATAFYGVPLLMEGRYLRLEKAFAIGYRQTFLSAGAWAQPSFHKSPGWLLLLATVLAAAKVLSGRAAHPRRARVWLACCALSAFMMSRWSVFLWDRSELLQHNVFPHRFLIEMIFFSTLLVFTELPGAGRAGKAWLRAASVAAVLQGVFFMSRQVRGVVSPAEMDARVPRLVAAYASRPSGFGIDEFKARVDMLPLAEEGRIIGSLGAGRLRPAGPGQRYAIEPPIDRDGLYRLERSWTVRSRPQVQGRPAAALADPKGMLVLEMRRGDGELSLDLETPWYAALSALLSAAAWVGLLGTALGAFSRRQKNGK